MTTNVGELVKKRMRSAGMSGRELARRAGCTEGAVRQLLRGSQRSGAFRGLRAVGGKPPLILRVQRVLEIPDVALRSAIQRDDAIARRLSVAYRGSRASADSVLRRHRTAILEAARRRGARDVRVFGSRARGDARPDSDVDLLVAFEAGRSLIDLSGLMLDLKEILQRDVDVVTENGLHHAIRDRVLAEAVPV
ncbi:MAG: nucleotidyltransferase domain-containing protein [Actinomycetota bacterium]